MRPGEVYESCIDARLEALAGRIRDLAQQKVQRHEAHGDSSSTRVEALEAQARHLAQEGTAVRGVRGLR